MNDILQSYNLNESGVIVFYFHFQFMLCILTKQVFPDKNIFSERNNHANDLRIQSSLNN